MFRIVLISTFLIFVFGCTDGKYEYHSNGEIKSVTKIRNDTTFKNNYYDNGVLSEEIIKYNNKLTSLYFSYRVDGSLDKVVSYKEGLQHGETRYFTAMKKLKAYLEYYKGEVYFKKIYKSKSQTDSMVVSYIGGVPIIKTDEEFDREKITSSFYFPIINSEYPRDSFTLTCMLRKYVGSNLKEERLLDPVSFESDSILIEYSTTGIDSLVIAGFVTFKNDDEEVKFEDFEQSILIK